MKKNEQNMADETTQKAFASRGLTRRSLMAGVASAAMARTLLVGFDQSYPPYGYVGDDGEYTGFDLDLARAVAEEQGWEVELQEGDWDAQGPVRGRDRRGDRRHVR